MEERELWGLLTSHENSDFHILCKDEKVVYFNKHCAAYSCLLFRSKIEYESLNGNTGIIKYDMTQTEYSIVMELLKYIYLGLDINLTKFSDLLTLAEIAHEFNLSSLLQELDEKLCKFGFKNTRLDVVKKIVQLELTKTMDKIALYIPENMVDYPLEIICRSKYDQISSWMKQNPTLNHEKLVLYKISKTGINGSTHTIASILTIINESNCTNKTNLIGALINKLH